MHFLNIGYKYFLKRYPIKIIKACHWKLINCKYDFKKNRFAITVEKSELILLNRRNLMGFKIKCIAELCI